MKTNGLWNNCLQPSQQSRQKTGLLSSWRNKRHVNATLNWDACLEGANKQIQNWTDYWYNQKYAIFAAATAAPHRSGYSSTTFRNQTWMYHLTFTSNRGQGGFREARFVRDVFQVRTAHQWYCIDKNESRVLAEVPLPFHGYTLTVICPTSMELHRIEATILPKTQQAYSFPPVVSYHVQPHVDCARQRMHTQQQQQQQATQQPPNIVSCTLIKGDVSRTILVEWIEYHRMIGIEHFMVYMHEPYRSNLPKLPYVEYIPFDVEGNVVAQQALFLFQLSQQNDCLARARALGSKWVTTHDVDEYIHVMPLPTNSTAVGPGSLLSILEEVVAAKPEIGAVHLTEAHFGQFFQEPGTSLANATTTGQLNGNSPAAPSLVMDYVYRGPLLGAGGKVIMRPENVKYTFVHEVVSGGPNEPIDPSVVRLNHYRRPHLPPIEKSRDLLDTSLRDGYRDRLAQRLKELNSTL